jgi:hypothetical protein
MTRAPRNGGFWMTTEFAIGTIGCEGTLTMFKLTLKAEIFAGAATSVSVSVARNTPLTTERASARSQMRFQSASGRQRWALRGRPISP